MTDKEILAELKRSYEYLIDIRENGSIDHCSGQMKDNLDKLNESINNIVDIYSDFYKTLDLESLRVKKLEDSKDYKVYIGSDIDTDYIVYDINTKESYERYYITCEDVSYYWYEDYTFLNKVEESEQLWKK